MNPAPTSPAAPTPAAPRHANVAAYLPEMARSHPHMRAVVYPEGRDSMGRVAYTHLTFKQLDEYTDRIAHALDRNGIRRGTRTVLMVTPSLEFFALTFALFKVGAVIVLVDPGIGIKNLGKCLAESQPEAFVGVPKAHTARVLFRWARPTLKTLLTVGPRAPWGGTTLARALADAPATPYPICNPPSNETAAILFTSGSTGVPKGAIYTHGIFAWQVELIRHRFGIEPGEIDLPTFPLFALFDPALGMTAIIPDMDATRPGSVDPRKIAEAIENHGVTNMFGSPALVDRVGRWGVEQGVRFPTLRRVLSAGAPVAPAVLERFGSLLPAGAEIFTPYGATESLPVAAIGSHEILGETAALTAMGKGICVGRPVPPVEVRIIRISDEPIPDWTDDLLLATEGEIGEIAVRGPIVTEAYFNRPDQTALAKIRAADGSIWHRMGDVGYLDATGRLWFCGRKSHRVATPAGTLFTIPCEAIFNAHPQVRRTALVGVGERGRQEPALCVELEPGIDAAAFRSRIAPELRELGAACAHTRDIRRMHSHPRFPVDIRHNAKIGREILAAWAAKQPVPPAEATR